MITEKIHPHDVGLPEPAVRRRRKSRRVARMMLITAGFSAVAGWTLYYNSIHWAVNAQEQPPALAIIAYGLLIISSVTLVLGLWYLLLAQVERVARIIEAPEEDASPALRCLNCGWTHDPPDRFCRHCGKPLGTSIAAPPPSAVAPAPRTIP